VGGQVMSGRIHNDLSANLHSAEALIPDVDDFRRDPLINSAQIATMPDSSAE